VLKQALQNVTSERNSARADVLRLAGSIAEVEREAERLRDDLAASIQRGAELRQELRRVECERDRLAFTIAKDRDALAVQQQELARVGTHLSARQDELARAQDMLAEKKKMTEQLLEDKHALQVECGSFWEHHSEGPMQQMKVIAERQELVSKLSRQIKSTESELGAQQGDTGQLQDQIQALEKELATAEQSRRDLRNTIQELKGNIRVCCRVRPMLDNDADCAVYVPEPNKVSVRYNNQYSSFSFDKVFDAHTAQADVCVEIDGLVQSALDGYKVGILAYGQTGAGKTYTITGTKEPGKWGIIPWSLSKVCQGVEAMRCKGWVWSVQASYMGVYKEGLIDLLCSNNCSDRSEGPAAGHVIMHDENWGTVVTNMTCVEVESAAQTTGLIEKASQQRAMGSSGKDSFASCSHSVFVLYLKGSNAGLGSDLHGVLNLVDLAGSEMLDKAVAGGDRLKEPHSINKSLVSLVDVLVAKGEGQGHVPFRNSKLTHLLEPCISGQGKTLVIVNLAPERASAVETLGSLRFAKQIGQSEPSCKTPRRSIRATSTRSNGSPPQTPRHTPRGQRSFMLRTKSRAPSS